jgi:hypothetical protein
MRLQASRSITLPLFVLSLAACPGDPTPVDTTDGSTTGDPSTSADPTSNTGPSTTDEPTSTSVGTTATTTTGDPTDTETTSTTAVDSSTSTDTTDTTDTSETTHASHEGSSSADAESSSTDAESSSSSDGGVNPDCAAGDGPIFTVTNNAQSDYVINGQNDPGITVVRGCAYTFDITANGHPFYIKTIQGAGAGNAYGDGVVGNGTSNGDLTWTVADDAPDDLFYNCSFHAAMTGEITVIDP